MSDLYEAQKRRLVRREVVAKVEVIDINRGELLGTLVNIHEEGLLVVGPKIMREDHVYQLEFKLPTPVSGIDSIQLGVDCLWVKSADDSGLCWSGCHIIDLSDQAREQIEKVIESITR